MKCNAYDCIYNNDGYCVEEEDVVINEDLKCDNYTFNGFITEEDTNLCSE